jgi:imidazolonepropionase-like amidohydrolase
MARATLGSLLTVSLALFACGGPEGPALVRAPETLPAALLFRNVAVLDVIEGDLQADRDVLVRDGVIRAVEPGGSIESPAGTEVIEGAGATLLPGLIDAHVHITSSIEPHWVASTGDPEANLRAYLYAGVTTVFDTGNADPGVFVLRRSIEAGELLGPQMFAAGKLITAPDGHPVALIREIAPWWLGWFLSPRAAHQPASPAEARAAVAEVVRSGADFVKVVVDRIPVTAPRIQTDELRATVDEAFAHGLRTVAHIGSVDDALASARAGVYAWLHGVYTERIPDAAIPVMAGTEIPMAPTLVVWESLATLRAGSREPTRLEREIASPELLASYDDVPTPEESRLLRVLAPYLDRLESQRFHWPDNVVRLHRAGVTILAGSDAQPGVFPGAGLHREIHLLHRAGLAPIEALRAATLYAARFLTANPDPPFGVVARGKRADLLLVRGDPLADLGAIDDIQEVVAAGVRIIRQPGY